MYHILLSVLSKKHHIKGNYLGKYKKNPKRTGQDETTRD